MRVVDLAMTIMSVMRSPSEIKASHQRRCDCPFDVWGPEDSAKFHYDHNRQTDHANAIQTARKITTFKYRRTSSARSGITIYLPLRQAHLLKFLV
jgi:hypothetical protein